MSDIWTDIENEGVQTSVGDNDLAWDLGTKVLALCTADPGDSGASPANEVVGGSYARQTITFSAPEPGASGRKMENSNTIIFSGMPATTVTHWVIIGSNNVIWFKGTFSPSIPCASGQEIEILPDGISFEIDGDGTDYLRDGIFNALRGNANWNWQADALEITLCSADPGTGAVANELTGINRQDVKAAFGLPISDGNYKNSQLQITFNEISSQTAAWAAIVNSSDGDKVIWRFNIADETGTLFKFGINDVSITLA